MIVPKNLKSRPVTAAATLFALAGMLSGCSTLPADSPTEAVDYRACLVTDGDPNRIGINDSSLYSLNQAVVTFGIQKTVVATNPSKFETTMNRLVKAKCNLISVVGSRFAESLVGVVSANPETHFLFITDGLDPEILGTDLENLAVYRIDVYEAGLLAGHAAASFSENRELAIVCGSSVNVRYLDGVRAGVSAFDSQNKVTTRLTSDGNLNRLTDVILNYGCRDQIPTDDAYVDSFKVVGFGRDLYFDPAFENQKALIAATVIPQAGPRLLELIAADLESEFIGGPLGSTVASFNNGGLLMSQEHEVAYPAGELDALKALATQYEISLK